MNLRQWRVQRNADEQAKKALRHAGRLSSAQILDTVDQTSFALGQACTSLRQTSDREVRYQILCEAKAAADTASILLEKLVELQELRLNRVGTAEH